MLNINAAVANATAGNVETTGLEGKATLVPLYMERGGLNTNLIGVQTKGGLFRFLPDVSNQGVNGFREAAQNDPVPVTVTPGLVVIRTSASSGNERRIGRLGDFRSQPYDASKSVNDRATGERRARKFLPIILVAEDEESGVFRLTPPGKKLLGEAFIAMSDEADLMKILGYLPQAFPGDFQIDDEGNLTGQTPEGVFFLNELNIVLGNGVETEPVTEENAEADDAAAVGL